MTPRILSVAMLVLLAADAVLGDGWDQWRGPGRNGIAASGPALADQWPNQGPSKLWESEAIPSNDKGGFSTVAVADGRAYVYVNWKGKEPIATRRLTEDSLRALGWTALKVPSELAAALETARTGAELNALDANGINPWISRWIAQNVTDANDNKNRPLCEYLRHRLAQRNKGVPAGVLDKLAAIKNKEFASAAELDQWFADQGIAGGDKDQVVRVIPTTHDVAQDLVVCLDAKTGKTLWKKEFPGIPSGWGSSSTACVTGGRCYAAGSEKLYCLDAATGDKLWEAKLPGREVSSSPVVVDGVVAVLGGSLVAFDAADGNELWKQPKLTGNNPSPVVWTGSGRSYLLCNSEKGIGCVDPKTGQILWTAPGGGNGTVVVSDDVAVILSDNKTVGLSAYKLSAEKADKLWSTTEASGGAADPNARPMTIVDRGSTPIIYDGGVYVLGGGFLGCFRLADGKPAWIEKRNTEITSPLLADGKVIATVDGQTLLMFKASPDAYKPLGKAAVGAARCSSPTLADGKLFLRLNNTVACYDLRAEQK